MEDPQNSNTSAFNNSSMMSKPVMAKKPNVKKMAFEDSDEEDSKPIGPPVIRQPPTPVSQPPPQQKVEVDDLFAGAAIKT